MTDEILGRPLADFNALYRSKATSEEGQELVALIKEHFELMQVATENGRPAIAPLLSILSRELNDRLHADHHLLRTFGHLVGVQMESQKYRWDVEDQTQRQNVNWPYSAKVSQCQIYHQDE